MCQGSSKHSYKHRGAQGRPTVHEVLMTCGSGAQPESTSLSGCGRVGTGKATVFAGCLGVVIGVRFAASKRNMFHHACMEQPNHRAHSPCRLRIHLACGWRYLQRNLPGYMRLRLHECGRNCPYIFLFLVWLAETKYRIRNGLSLLEPSPWIQPVRHHLLQAVWCAS